MTRIEYAIQRELPSGGKEFLNADDEHQYWSIRPERAIRFDEAGTALQFAQDLGAGVSVALVAITWRRGLPPVIQPA